MGRPCGLLPHLPGATLIAILLLGLFPRAASGQG